MSGLVKHRLLILGILLLGAGLRLHQGTANVRFHPDEALYTAYARRAAVYGDWLLNAPVDKPPLSIYANALGLHFFAARTYTVIDIPLRTGEFAAKTPNIFSGVVLIALVYALARQLYPKQTHIAWFAALITALSPYAVAFSASAFTDMLMLSWMLAALLAALHHKPGWAGSMVALSIWTKPQGILFLPLTLWFMGWRGISRFLLVLGVGIISLWLWDAIRPQVSFWVLGAAHINPGRIISSPMEWLPRLQNWLNHCQQLLGAPWINWLLIVLVIFTGFKHRHPHDLKLFLMVSGYFVFHWLNAYPTFDRYMLPMVPLLAILAARAIPNHYMPIATLLIMMSLFSRYNPRQDALHGQNPDTLINLATWLDSKPLGTIIYNPWLGWEMEYYRGAWSNKRWVYYPNAMIQAQDAQLNPDPAPRYFIIPFDHVHDPQTWLQALIDAGFVVQLAYAQGGFHIYELIPP
ncbi:MAG: hypothetical protein CUN56_04930 [Phototrophicales bacterium]|nr:MAG: hypothetical protein CUN56_04930 [Phototrophicales bacterium]